MRLRRRFFNSCVSPKGESSANKLRPGMTENRSPRGSRKDRGTESPAAPLRCVRRPGLQPFDRLSKRSRPAGRLRPILRESHPPPGSGFHLPNGSETCNSTRKEGWSAVGLLPFLCPIFALIPVGGRARSGDIKRRKRICSVGYTTRVSP
jgi:hypothetical protein